MVGSSFPGVGVSSHGVYRPDRFLLGVVDDYDRLRDFSYSLSRLDFSHCAAYQSASIKCFIRAMGLFAGPCSRATRKKSLRQPTTAASARGGVGRAPERRASGLRRLARKRHRVHFRALRPSTNRAQGTHLAHLILSGWVRSVSIPFSVKWLKSSGVFSQSLCWTLAICKQSDRKERASGVSSSAP